MLSWLLTRVSHFMGSGNGYHRFSPFSNQTTIHPQMILDLRSENSWKRWIWRLKIYRESWKSRMIIKMIWRMIYMIYRKKQTIKFWNKPFPQNSHWRLSKSENYSSLTINPSLQNNYEHHEELSNYLDDVENEFL